MEDSTLPSRETRARRHRTENQQMRLVRKQLKRNREPNRVRTRNWLRREPSDTQDLDEWNTTEEWDSPQSERVMPIGERERRDANRVRLLALLGEQEQTVHAETPADGAGAQGIVLEVSTGLCRVDVHGRQVLCSLRGSLGAVETGFTNVVAVGDQVYVEEANGAQGVVTGVLPRRSVLVRPDVFQSHLQQVIVANADQLLIVASWREPPIWLELIDRYLIAAERNALTPVICVNKVDLADNTEACRLESQPYLRLGHPVLFTSATRGDGVDDLRQRLRDRTTVLAGLSGVGKSSLLQAVQPGLRLRTSEVSERRHAGRHTTTQVNMLRLEAGGFVVDTPGIREFGLVGLARRDLAQYYPEIVALGIDCRFGDCSHMDEPDCAVRAGVGSGLVSTARYHNYRKIWSELPR